MRCASRKPEATRSSPRPSRPARASNLGRAPALAVLQSKGPTAKSASACRAPRSAAAALAAARQPQPGQRAAATTATPCSAANTTRTSPSGPRKGVYSRSSTPWRPSSKVAPVWVGGQGRRRARRVETQPNELSGHQKKLLKIDDHLVLTQRHFRTFPNFNFGKTASSRCPTASTASTRPPGESTSRGRTGGSVPHR